MIAVVRPTGATARQYAPDTWLVVELNGHAYIEAPGLSPIHVSGEDVAAAERSMYAFVDAKVHEAHRRRLLDEATDERFAVALARSLRLAVAA